MLKTVSFRKLVIVGQEVLINKMDAAEVFMRL